MKKVSDIISPITDIFRPVLSDRTILKYIKKGLLITTPIVPKQIQPNSVDITLGNTWKKLKINSYGGDFPDPDVTSDMKFIDTREEILYDEGNFKTIGNLGLKEYYILMPHEFVLMASNEILNIPNGILCFVQGRSSIARLAIQTEQAGLIDAGFTGTITFEVFNQSDYPIILYSGMRIAQLYFFKSQHALFPYGSKQKGSKYQTQIKATGSKIHLDFTG